MLPETDWTSSVYTESEWTLWHFEKGTRKKKKKSVRGGIRTHAHIRGPEVLEPASQARYYT